MNVRQLSAVLLLFERPKQAGFAANLIIRNVFHVQYRIGNDALCEQMKRDTMELMGASDTALGNVKPENTSAIVTVQQATIIASTFFEMRKRLSCTAYRSSTSLLLPP